MEKPQKERPDVNGNTARAGNQFHYTDFDLLVCRKIDLLFKKKELESTNNNRSK